MKIYAKQINPEFQESLLFEDGLFPENMVVCGNRDFKEQNMYSSLHSQCNNKDTDAKVINYEN